jgi:GNAT superfamily N-acetyltransferase
MRRASVLPTNFLAETRVRAAGTRCTLKGMKPEIAPLDRADDATVDAVLALRTAVEAAEVPDFPAPCPYAFRGELAHPVSTKRKERFVARHDGELVGYLVLELPMREDLADADVELCVHPAYRRRGFGRALHTHMADRLRELGRKRCVAFCPEPEPGGPVPGGPERAGGRFARAMGAKAALDEIRRRLDLTTVDDAALAELADAAAERAAGYRLVTWRDRTPDEYAADAVYLSGRLVSDAPMGDLHWEPPRMDVARLREAEAARAVSRTRLYSAGVVHESSGRLVAVTAIALEESSPWHAWQWITLVEPRHRGHRLGMLVKVGNLRFARSYEPALRAVDTWNAEANQHMIAINEAMGYRPAERWINWQQEL